MLEDNNKLKFLLLNKRKMQSNYKPSNCVFLAVNSSSLSIPS